MRAGSPRPYLVDACIVLNCFQPRLLNPLRYEAFEEVRQASLRFIAQGCISAVQYAEVLDVLIKRFERTPDVADSEVAALGLKVLPFAQQEARAAAKIRAATLHKVSASLGDLAFLSTAVTNGVTPVTGEYQLIAAWQLCSGSVDFAEPVLCTPFDSRK